MRSSLDLGAAFANGHHPDGRPASAEIRQRVGEIVFNASLVAEMQAIHAMRRMQSDGAVAQMRFHRIGPPRERAAAGPATGALDRSWARLKRPHGQGRRDAARFVARHRADLGARSTLDLAATYLNPSKPRLRRAAVSSDVASADRLSCA